MAVLLQMSLSAGAMILVLALLRRFLLPKVPARLLPWLWLPVGMRLLVPVDLPLLPAGARLLKHIRLPVVNAVQPTVGGVEAALQLPVQTGNALQGAGVAPVSEGIAAAGAVQISPVFLIWLCGLAATLIAFCLLRLYWHRRLAKATYCDDGALVGQWLTQQVFYRPVHVLMGDRVPAPMTCGVFRPRIYLPAGMENTPTLSHVLVHEGEHIRHFHAAVKAMMGIVICLHWFNPLVWYMARMLSRDLEMACDAHVLRRLGTENTRAYASALVCLATEKSGPAWMSTFAGHPIQERVVYMLKPVKMKLSGIIALCMVLVLSVGMFAVAAEVEMPGEATYLRITTLGESKWLQEGRVSDRIQEGHVMSEMMALPVTRAQAENGAKGQGLTLMLPNPESLPEGYTLNPGSTHLYALRRCEEGCHLPANDYGRQPLIMAAPDRAPDVTEEKSVSLHEKWHVQLDDVMAYYDGITESYSGPAGTELSLTISWDTTEGIRNRYYNSQKDLLQAEQLANGLVVIREICNGDYFYVVAIPVEIRDALMADWQYDAVVPTYVWESVEGSTDRETVNALVKSLEAV